MSPALVVNSDEIMNDVENPRKRGSSATNELPVTKRPRTLSFRSLDTGEADGTAQDLAKVPTSAELARAGLRRSITLALEQVGFHSASEESLESFSTIVETCKTISVLMICRQHCGPASNAFLKT
jgi:hypothetical protein